MENANVVIIEDGVDHRQIVQRWIDASGHTITREAINFNEALTVIDEIAAGEVPCDVIILDGNLDPSIPADYRHAQAITGKLREYELGVKVIGFASDRLLDYGIEVDVDLTKARAAELIATIASF